MKIGIVYSEKLKSYDFGPGHPFRGDRFVNFMEHFRRVLAPTGRFEVLLNDEPATDEDLLLWHEMDYIHAVKKSSAGQPPSDISRYLSGDNVNPWTRNLPIGIEEAARVVVKNSMLACDLVEAGKFEKAVSIGGGLHHARPRYGEGFCIYNDVVIAGKHLINKFKTERILILDTDAHAGNGTCEAFYADPRVLFIDIHQKHIYPGTGYEDDVGDGQGKGFTANIPLPAFSGDEAYKLVFEEIILPLTKEFAPQFIIRNGGSDPHPSDEITQLGLTLEGFRYIGRMVREMAEVCGGKEVDLLCSGYKPEVLSQAWSALISGLASIEVELQEPLPLRIRKKNAAMENVRKTVARVRRNLRPYWKCIRS